MHNHSGRRAITRITLIGALLNLILAIGKTIAGWFGQSHALLADGIHSFSDLLTDALVLVAAHYSHQAADVDHPYGHARIETAATLALALGLTVVGVSIMADAAWRWYNGQFLQPYGYVIWIAALSIIFKEGMYHWTLRVARKTKSTLVRANAWHHRSDAGSSVIVVFGVAGTYLGFAHGDQLAAFLVGVLIIKMGWGLGWSSLRELVDTGVDSETLAKITDVICSVPGVRSIHQLRTRSMGGAIFVDVHLLVDPAISVSEGHFIGQQVHLTLTRELADVVDVTTHIDSEEDSMALLSYTLPNRPSILPQLTQRWQSLPGNKAITKVQLHYWAGQLHVELYLVLDDLTDIDTIDVLEKEYQQAVQDLAQLSLVFVSRSGKITPKSVCPP